MLQKLTMMSAVTVLSSFCTQPYKVYADAVQQTYQHIASEQLISPLVAYLKTLEQACDELLRHQSTLRTFLQATTRRRHLLTDSIRAHSVATTAENEQRLEKNMGRYLQELQTGFAHHFIEDECPALHQVVKQTQKGVDEVREIARSFGARVHETVAYDMLQIHAKVAHALEGALEISEDDWYDTVSGIKDYIVRSQIEYLEGKKSLEEVYSDIEIAAFCVISLVNNFNHHYSGHITDDGMGLVRKIALLLNAR